MANELFPSSIISGNKAVKTFTRNGLEIGVKPIEEITLLSVGAIGAVGAKTLDLSSLNYDVKLLAVNIVDENATNNFTITITDGYKIVCEYHFNETSMNSDVPPTIIKQGYTITIAVASEILHATLLVGQVSVLESLTV
jgi:hypothetical protein